MTTNPFRPGDLAEHKYAELDARRVHSVDGDTIRLKLSASVSDPVPASNYRCLRALPDGLGYEEISPSRECAYAQEGITTDDADDGPQHVVIFVTEDEPGYYESNYVGDLDYCREVAASINRTRGLSDADVLDIVASSMASASPPDDETPEQ